MTLQPPLSYRLTDRLSVGVGPTLNRIDGDGEVKIEDDDLALGYNAGLLFEPSPQTRFGLTYHSRVEHRLEGETRVSGPGFVIGFSAGTYDASLALTAPGIGGPLRHPPAECRLGPRPGLARIDHSSASKGVYRSSYRNSAHGLGAQLTYRF